jgi:hypothetical protein
MYIGEVSPPAELPPLSAAITSGGTNPTWMVGSVLLSEVDSNAKLASVVESTESTCAEDARRP